MPQYKYPVKGGSKWMTKFNYTDPKSGVTKTEYKRGFDSKREAKKYEEDFIESLITPEEDEIEPIRTFGDVFQEYLMSFLRLLRMTTTNPMRNDLLSQKKVVKS